MWIVSSCNEKVFDPPALIISAYEDLPRIFLNDPVKNAKWLEYEDTGVGWVYDIMYRGNIEIGVAHEWLRPLSLSKD